MTYQLTQDIVIPAGTVVSVDPPFERKHFTQTATVPVAVSNDVTAEWRMDLAEAIEEGIVFRTG